MCHSFVYVTIAPTGLDLHTKTMYRSVRFVILVKEIAVSHSRPNMVLTIEQRVQYSAHTWTIYRSYYNYKWC
jgi:hypothetical protein